MTEKLCEVLKVQCFTKEKPEKRKQRFSSKPPSSSIFSKLLQTCPGGVWKMVFQQRNSGDEERKHSLTLIAKVKDSLCMRYQLGAQVVKSETSRLTVVTRDSYSGPNPKIVH